MEKLSGRVISRRDILRSIGIIVGGTIIRGVVEPFFSTAHACGPGEINGIVVAPDDSKTWQCMPGTPGMTGGVVHEGTGQAANPVQPPAYTAESAIVYGQDGGGIEPEISQQGIFEGPDLNRLFDKIGVQNSSSWSSEEQRIIVAVANSSNPTWQQIKEANTLLAKKGLNLRFYPGGVPKNLVDRALSGDSDAIDALANKDMLPTNPYPSRESIPAPAIDESKFIYFPDMPNTYNIPWTPEAKQAAWQAYSTSLRRVEQILGRNTGPNRGREIFLMRKETEGAAGGYYPEWGKNAIVLVESGKEDTIGHEIIHRYSLPGFNGAWHTINDAVQAMVFDSEIPQGAAGLWYSWEAQHPGFLKNLQQWYGVQLNEGRNPSRDEVVSYINSKYPGFKTWAESNLSRWENIR